MKRRHLSLVCVGFVGANEYDWREQMEGVRRTVEKHGVVLQMDAGKVLGVAQHAIDLEDAARDTLAWFEQFTAHGDAGVGAAVPLRNRLRRLLKQP